MCQVLDPNSNRTTAKWSRSVCMFTGLRSSTVDSWIRIVVFNVFSNVLYGAHSVFFKKEEHEECFGKMNNYAGNKCLSKTLTSN